MLPWRWLFALVSEPAHKFADTLIHSYTHTQTQTHTLDYAKVRIQSILLIFYYYYDIPPNTTLTVEVKIFLPFFCLWQLRLILYLCRPTIWISNSYENLIHCVSGQGLRWIFPYSHRLDKVNKRTKNRKKMKKYPIGQQSFKELTVICEQFFPLTRMSIDCRKKWLKLKGKSSESSLVEWLVIIFHIAYSRKA